MLCSTGVSNTFITAVEATYSKVLSCVRVNDEFADMFSPRSQTRMCVKSYAVFDYNQ